MIMLMTFVLTMMMMMVMMMVMTAGIEASHGHDVAADIDGGTSLPGLTNGQLPYKMFKTKLCLHQKTT